MLLTKTELLKALKTGMFVDGEPLITRNGRKVFPSLPALDGSMKIKDEIFQAELAKERYPCGHDFS